MAFVSPAGQPFGQFQFLQVGGAATTPSATLVSPGGSRPVVLQLPNGQTLQLPNGQTLQLQNLQSLQSSNQSLQSKSFNSAAESSSSWA